MLRILYFSYCPPIIIELPPSGAQAPRWESLIQAESWRLINKWFLRNGIIDLKVLITQENNLLTYCKEGHLEDSDEEFGCKEDKENHGSCTMYMKDLSCCVNKLSLHSQQRCVGFQQITWIQAEQVHYPGHFESFAIYLRWAGFWTDSSIFLSRFQ